MLPVATPWQPKVDDDFFQISAQQQLFHLAPTSQQQQHLTENNLAHIVTQDQLRQAHLHLSGGNSTRGRAAQFHQPQLQHAQHSLQQLQQPDQLVPTAALASRNPIVSAPFDILNYSGSADISKLRHSLMNGSQQFAGHNLRPRAGRPFAATAAAATAAAAATSLPSPAHPTAAAAAAAAADAAAAATAAAANIQKPMRFHADPGGHLAPAAGGRARLDDFGIDDDDDDYDSCSSADMSISSRQQGSAAATMAGRGAAAAGGDPPLVGALVANNIKTAQRWTPEEHEQLLRVVAQFGNNRRWSEIARHIPGRSGKQCRERYVNHMDPASKKGPWEVKEELLLCKWHSILGSHWAKITRKLEGRTENAVKNHWNAAIRAKFPARRQTPLNLYVGQIKRGIEPADALVQVLESLQPIHPELVAETAIATMDIFSRRHNLHPLTAASLMTVASTTAAAGAAGLPPQLGPAAPPPAGDSPLHVESAGFALAASCPPGFAQLSAQHLQAARSPQAVMASAAAADPVAPQEDGGLAFDGSEVRPPPGLQLVNNQLQLPPLSAAGGGLVPGSTSLTGDLDPGGGLTASAPEVEATAAVAPPNRGSLNEAAARAADGSAGTAAAAAEATSSGLEGQVFKKARRDSGPSPASTGTRVRLGIAATAAAAGEGAAAAGAREGAGHAAPEAAHAANSSPNAANAPSWQQQQQHAAAVHVHPHHHHHHHQQQQQQHQVAIPGTAELHSPPSMPSGFSHTGMMPPPPAGSAALDQQLQLSAAPPQLALTEPAALIHYQQQLQQQQTLQHHHQVLLARLVEEEAVHRRAAELAANAVSEVLNTALTVLEDLEGGLLYMDNLLLEQQQQQQQQARQFYHHHNLLYQQQQQAALLHYQQQQQEKMQQQQRSERLLARVPSAPPTLQDWRDWQQQQQQQGEVHPGRVTRDPSPYALTAAVPPQPLSAPAVPTAAAAAAAGRQLHSVMPPPYWHWPHTVTTSVRQGSRHHQQHQNHQQQQQQHGLYRSQSDLAPAGWSRMELTAGSTSSGSIPNSASVPLHPWARQRLDQQQQHGAAASPAAAAAAYVRPFSGVRDFGSAASGLLLGHPIYRSTSVPVLAPQQRQQPQQDGHAEAEGTSKQPGPGAIGGPSKLNASTAAGPSGTSAASPCISSADHPAPRYGGGGGDDDAVEDLTPGSLGFRLQTDNAADIAAAGTCAAIRGGGGVGGSAALTVQQQPLAHSSPGLSGGMLRSLDDSVAEQDLLFTDSLLS